MKSSQHFHLYTADPKRINFKGADGYATADITEVGTGWVSFHVSPDGVNAARTLAAALIEAADYVERLETP